jgi:hypothetical protein
MAVYTYIYVYAVHVSHWKAFFWEGVLVHWTKSEDLPMPAYNNVCGTTDMGRTD